MARQTDAVLRTAAERAAAQVLEVVTEAAREACERAVRDTLERLVGGSVADVDVAVEDRVTRTEAARRLGTTSQTIIRLEKKGAVRSERTDDGRVYVRLSDVEDALAGGGNVTARARVRRSAS